MLSRGDEVNHVSPNNHNKALKKQQPLNVIFLIKLNKILATSVSHNLLEQTEYDILKYFFCFGARQYRLGRLLPLAP